MTEPGHFRDKLLQLAPENANKLDGDTLKSVASASLVVGDRILVRPGERIPVDGRIVEGNTELDESSITGEPMPVLRQQGEDVSAGTLNLLTSVTLEVTHVAGESFVARMARLVEEAQNRKAPIQSLADKVARQKAQIQKAKRELEQKLEVADKLHNEFDEIRNVLDGQIGAIEALDENDTPNGS